MSDAEQISERVVRANRQESKDKLCVRMAESGSWCCSYHEGYEDGADAALREANMLREGPDCDKGRFEIVLESMGEASAVFMSNPLPGTEQVMPEAQLAAMAERTCDALTRYEERLFDRSIEGPDVPTGTPIDSIGVSGVPEQEVNEFLTDVRRPDVAAMLDALQHNRRFVAGVFMPDSATIEYVHPEGFNTFVKAPSLREAVAAAFEALPTETNP